METGKKKAGRSEAVNQSTRSTYRGHVKTGSDFAAMMSCLMHDLLNDKIHPNRANAICNAGGKLLKIVELERKYGTRKSIDDEKRTLTLVSK